MRRRKRAFSLLELLVVIGVVLILIGLVLPMLAGSLTSARAVRSLATLQQNATIVSQYAAAYQDAYPFYETTRSVDAALRWARPMVAAGLFASVEESDPDGYRREGETNVVMSECMVYKAEWMVPGMTEPEDRRRPFQVRIGDVRFPDCKGLFRLRKVDGVKVRMYWCCVDGAPKGPVAFADGSATQVYWRDLLPNGVLYVENGIGHPVSQTWNGVHGRDRQ